MPLLRLIGDVHGKYRRYKRLLKITPFPSIQVGDMGVGFLYYSHEGDIRFCENPPYKYMIEGPHRFLRGNHDNPAVCKRHKLWIPDGTVENDMMFIGGAVSIDRADRKEGQSWWPDEEPSHAELLAYVDVYLVMQPRIMITHECPEEVADVIMSKKAGLSKIHDGSRCRQAFQAMHEFHQPRLWVFGHWHVSIDTVYKGTRFICLAELEWMDLDTETLEIVNRGQA